MLNTPERTDAGTMVAVPNSLIQTSALAAASLFSLLTLLVEEFETLHSMGIIRPSQRRTMRSTFRPPPKKIALAAKLAHVLLFVRVAA